MVFGCSCISHIFKVLPWDQSKIWLWSVDIHIDFQYGFGFGISGRGVLDDGSSETGHHSCWWSNLHYHLHCCLSCLGWGNSSQVSYFQYKQVSQLPWRLENYKKKMPFFFFFGFSSSSIWHNNQSSKRTMKNNKG